MSFTHDISPTDRLSARLPDCLKTPEYPLISLVGGIIKHEGGDQDERMTTINMQLNLKM